MHVLASPDYFFKLWGSIFSKTYFNIQLQISQKNIILLYILESIFIDFGTFLASWDLPGASWSLLGPPLETPSQIWTTKEGPRVAPRGSWGGLWVDLGVLLGALNTSLGKIFDTLFGTCFPRGFQTSFGKDFAWFLVDFLVTFWNNIDDWSATEKRHFCY